MERKLVVHLSILAAIGVAALGFLYSRATGKVVGRVGAVTVGGDVKYIAQSSFRLLPYRETSIWRKHENQVVLDNEDGEDGLGRVERIALAKLQALNGGANSSSDARKYMDAWERATAELRPLEMQARAEERYFEFTTDFEGRFQVSNVPPGAYYIVGRDKMPGPLDFEQEVNVNRFSTVTINVSPGRF